jgi:hypothetical protein
MVKLAPTQPGLHLALPLHQGLDQLPIDLATLPLLAPRVVVLPAHAQTPAYRSYVHTLGALAWPL